jgi:predicted phage tail protein
VSWQDASSDETGFRVQRSADGSTNWTLVATLGANVTSYQDTGLTAGTTYYYRVRAYNAAGNSGFSNTASATTLADTASITLAWDDNSTTESGFRVERSPNGTSSWTEIGTTNANVTTYQNTGLTRGATYYYRVRAYTATEFSAYSNTLQVNVP